MQHPRQSPDFIAPLLPLQSPREAVKSEPFGTAGQLPAADPGGGTLTCLSRGAAGGPARAERQVLWIPQTSVSGTTG